MPHFPPILECRRFLDRARGVIGREHLLRSRAVLIKPCRAIHTFGLRHAIDVAFLDAQGQVLEVVSAVPPWRWRRARCRDAYACLEACAGAFAQWPLRVGDRPAWRVAGKLTTPEN